MYPSDISHAKSIWSVELPPTSDAAFASASLRDRPNLRRLVGLSQVAQPSYDPPTESNAIELESRDQLHSTCNVSTNQEADAIVNSSSSNPSLDLGDISVTSFGTIHLRLSGGLVVNLTIDKAIYVYAHLTNTVISLSASGSHAVLMHHMGCVYQYGSRVEVLANDETSKKYAKIWHRGISVASDSCPDVYLIESDEITRIKDNFMELNYNVTHNVFYDGSRHGPEYIQEAMAMIRTSKHWISQNGSKIYVINNIRISQRTDGMLCIARDFNKYTVTMTPATNAAMLRSNYLQANASLGNSGQRHLYVCRGVRRIHYDGSAFLVRNYCKEAKFLKNSHVLMF